MQSVPIITKTSSFMAMAMHTRHNPYVIKFVSDLRLVNCTPVSSANKTN